MQETFEKLRQLQDVLSRKFQVEQEIEEIPKGLATKKEMLTRLKKQYIEKNSAYDELKARVKQYRFDLDEAERKRMESEKKMDSITTQREYEALDKEISDAQEIEQRIRRELLKEEKNLEELKKTLERDEGLIQLQTTDMESEKEKINEEVSQRKDQLSQLEQEETSITPGMDEEILFKFERIIRNKAGLGIVPVQGQVCKGCHMILPGQFVNDVRDEKGILFCPYCSRILFHQDAGESNKDVSDFVDSEAGGLSDLVSDSELE